MEGVGRRRLPDRPQPFRRGAIYRNPRCGDVYNLGGGRENSCSILEAFEKVEQLSGIAMKYEYVPTNREGDHVCYISNLTRLQRHYPQWKITRSLDQILREIIDSWKARL